MNDSPEKRRSGTTRKLVGSKLVNVIGSRMASPGMLRVQPACRRQCGLREAPPREDRVHVELRLFEVAIDPEFAVVVEIPSNLTTTARTAREPVPGRKVHRESPRGDRESGARGVARHSRTSTLTGDFLLPQGERALGDGADEIKTRDVRSPPEPRDRGAESGGGNRDLRDESARPGLVNRRSRALFRRGARIALADRRCLTESSLGVIL
jgi:hypothetical protein